MDILEEFKIKIRQAVLQGEPILLKIRVLDEEDKSQIRFILKFLATHYKSEELSPYIYSCIRESILNGVKANLKHYIFNLNNIMLKCWDNFLIMTR
jgi:hypothetical protein